jgi:hypothetical protein
MLLGLQHIRTQRATTKFQAIRLLVKCQDIVVDRLKILCNNDGVIV